MCAFLAVALLGCQSTQRNTEQTPTARLGSASEAWVDLVDGVPNRVATPRSYEWVELCGRPMKAGIYELHAGGRYLIQLSASPDATVDLFVSGPLREDLKLQ